MTHLPPDCPDNRMITGYAGTGAMSLESWGPYMTPETVLDRYVEWARSYSYGKLFPLRAVFITEDGGEFYDLSLAMSHNAETSVRARHRGLLPSFLVEYEVEPGTWVRSDIDRFNEVMSSYVDAQWARIYTTLNKQSLADLYREGMSLDELALSLAEAGKVIDPPAMWHMPMM